MRIFCDNYAIFQKPSFDFSKTKYSNENYFIKAWRRRGLNLSSEMRKTLHYLGYAYPIIRIFPFALETSLSIRERPWRKIKLFSHFGRLASWVNTLPAKSVLCSSLMLNHKLFTFCLRSTGWFYYTIDYSIVSLKKQSILH